VTDLVSHPDDLLSALLDGELGAAEAEAVRTHLVSCSACAAELEAVRDSRATLRFLPAVEPPPGFVDAILRVEEEGGSGSSAPVVALRTPRAAMVNAAAAIAAGLFVLVGIGDHQVAGAVSPEVTGSVERHAATISAVTAGVGGPSPILAPGEVTATTAPRRSTDVSHPYAAPQRLAGYRLVDAFEAPHGLHLLYEKGPYALSVFEEEGDLDYRELPRRGTTFELGGDEGWRWDGGTTAGRVVVLARGGLVFTLVGDESDKAVLAAARALPGGPHPGLGTRVRRACGELLAGLSPVG
jgi:anti-sigma factor RsiW